MMEKLHEYGLIHNVYTLLSAKILTVLVVYCLYMNLKVVWFQDYVSLSYYYKSYLQCRFIRSWTMCLVTIQSRWPMNSDRSVHIQTRLYMRSSDSVLSRHWPWPTLPPPIRTFGDSRLPRIQWYFKTYISPSIISLYKEKLSKHYCDVIMGMMTSQITSLAIVCSTVYSDVDQRKHQSSASLAFVRGIHRWPVNSPQKGPVMQKMFPFDDVIMTYREVNPP